MDKEKLLINNPKSNNSEDMSNKQIEEMAFDICVARKAQYADGCRVCSQHENCLYQDIAYGLFNAGYRKQSEGYWMTYHCTNDGKSKRGRLVIYKTYTCDSCGKSNGRHKTNFCPHCGAEMITKPKGE